MIDLLRELAKLTFPGLAIAVATAFLTVRLSLRQFRREQLWAKRYDAYSRLLEILDTNKRYAALYEDHYLDMDPSKADSSKLDAIRKRWERQQPEYDRLLLLASVQLPKAARSALEAYEEERNRARVTDDILDAIDIDYKASVACMKTIGGIARKDLGVS